MINLASELRQIIVIQKLIIDENNTESWQDFLIVRAQVKTVYNGPIYRENFVGMQLLDNSYYQFKVRYNPEINSNLRIVYKDKYYYVKKLSIKMKGIKLYF